MTETDIASPYYIASYPEYDRSNNGFLIRDINKEPEKACFNKIFLVYDLHEDFDRNRGFSPLKGLLVDPIKKTGYFKEIVHLAREIMLEYGLERWISELLKECEINKPDIVVFHIPFFYQEGVAIALRHIRDNLKIPVLGYTTDFTTLLGGSYNRYKVFYDLFITCMTKTISIDTANPSRHYSGDFIIGFTLTDYQVFNPSLTVKETDVSFIGSITLWTNIGNSSRNEYIEYLKPRLDAAGIKYSFIDSTGHAASIEEYAKIINGSKMVINFSQTTAGNRHMKGRVFEALGSGALLLEEEGPETCCFFDSGRDYVEFCSPEDLFIKICYYSKNDTEREKIAASGHKKAVTLYNESNFFRYVLDELGLIEGHESSSEEYQNYINKINMIKSGL